jgi:hypothetical protein
VIQPLNSVLRHEGLSDRDLWSNQAYTTDVGVNFWFRGQVYF